MKILHMISGGDVGGAKTHVLSLVSGLNKTEKVHLVCFMEGEFAEDARALGIPTTVIEGNNLINTKKRILAMIRHDGYEIIHCHGARANMVGMLLRRQAKIPLISTVHSDYRLDYMGRPLANLTFGTINKMVLPRFDGWVGVSQGMTDLLASRGFDPQRIYTIYNGVDFSRPLNPVPRAEFLKKYGFSPEHVVYGIAARLNPVKDMATLIKAFSQAVRACPGIRLLIAGEGEEEAELKALAHELCPRGTVAFAGWVKDTDSFYNALDVNLLTSLSETFPYALTEGARLKCATIASNVGGVPCLIEDGSNGLLFEPRDDKALAQHMITLAGDSALREKLGQALYDKTKKEFSLEVMVARQKQIYETILRKTARPKDQRDGVVICGAYGKGNRGDNAILSAIVAQLRETDPDIPITALSRDPQEARVSTGVDSIYTFNIWKVGRRMKHARLYISGGGTLMQDATSTRSLLYYLFSIRQAARKGCKVMLYSCGIGPISRPRNRKRAAKILNRYADIIAVRDRYSREFLDTLGVDRPEIHLTADPALLIHPEDGTSQGSYLSQCGIREGKKYFLLSVRPWPGFEKHIGDFAEAVEYAREKYGLFPVLYCMEPSKDEGASRAVREKLRGPCLLLNAGSSGVEVLTLIQRMSLVVSMRLHTLIFAAGQNVPMVGVVYDPKVQGFLDYLENPHYLSLEDADAEHLKKLMDSALSYQDQNNLARLQSLSRENGRLAARLLKG